MKAAAQRKQSLKTTMHRLMILGLAPFALIIALQICMLLQYAQRYNSILHNVTAASEFNQSFKENIDLQMYYYVVDSRYSTGLPVAEVEAAQSLARELIDTTIDKQSRRAIESVLSLSENLEEKIYQVEATQSYDERQIQLEDNIYILTDLIQEYMYNYLYHEAAYLNELQADALQQARGEAAALALVALGIILFVLSRERKTNLELSNTIESIGRRVQDIGGGAFAPAPLPNTKIEDLSTLADGVEQMAARLQELMQRSKREQASLRKAELALLQAQINPHFLYNTLDTIIWLIETGQPQQAEEMVSNLSCFFRTSLSKGRDVITVHEETTHARSYMEIQQVRYRDILSYRIEIDPELDDCLIPKLTLQPLVENSLYHGIKLLRGPGRITVNGARQGEDVVLIVQDNGPGMSARRLAEVRATLEEESGAPQVGFGLATVHRRIRLLYGAPYGLQIDSCPAGTTVTVRLPFAATAAPEEQEESL